MGAPILIGTSGWHYPHWRGVFYPESLLASEWLGFYGRHFDTVEVNYSYYHLPTLKAVHDWTVATPPGFSFAVKASRYITHMKKLKDPGTSIAALLPVVEGFSGKRGPVLFQLPPRWGADPQRLEAFLDAWPAAIPCAFEFRDPDWHCEAVYAVLRRHHAAFCVFDLGGFRSPFRVTADFVYLRLHGPVASYGGRYGTEALREWAVRLKDREGAKTVYVYFNNDQAGAAVVDALELKDILGE